MTLVALCVALAFCFTGGLLAMFAKVDHRRVADGLWLTGFAVLHTLTLALRSRTLWLSCTYAVMIIFVWPVLAWSCSGWLDAVFGLRERFMRTRPPPVTAA